MKPLSREASAALSALKATDPTREDEARVRKNLERALGVAIPVAGVAAASAHAATSLVSAMGVGAKVAVLIAVTTVTATVVVSLSSKGGEGRGEERTASQRQVPAPKPKPEVVVEPEVVEPEAAEVVEPEAAAVVELPPPSRPRAPAPRPAEPPKPEAPVAMAETPPAEPPTPTAPPPPPTAETWDLEVEANFPNCDASTELRSAQSARALLNAERAADAVWLLGAYQRRCPSGRWSDEAWSVRMAGLCKLNRRAEVIGLLQWFSAEYPERRAAVMSELRSSCSDEVLKHGQQ